MTHYPDLNDRCVLITGGAAGIGAALVRSFDAQSARVHFCDVDEAAARRLGRQVSQRVHFRKVDLRNPVAVRRWVTDAGKREGAIHALINNAAADPRLSLESTTVEQWDDLIARNLRAYFLTMQAAVSWMPPGSAVINFSSITFHTGPAELSAYVATKSGIQGLTRSLARELGPRRIRVNTLSPGWIMTERQLRQFVTPTVKRFIRRVQCIPDLLQPEEIADVALFLASDASRAMTGQELLADRGWAHS